MPRNSLRLIRGNGAGSLGNGADSAKKLCGLEKRFTSPMAAEGLYELDLLRFPRPQERQAQQDVRPDAGQNKERKEKKA